MNRLCHRLVFSRRHGMLLAVADHACASGKAGRGDSRRRRSVLATAAVLALAAAAPPGGAQTAAPTAARPPVVFASQRGAPAAALPRPYANGAGKTFRPFAYDPALGAGSADLAASGKISWTVSADGRLATLDQGSQARVVLNWDSFDIAAGHRVHFKQDTDPTRYVSALNRIWSADPSLIFGALSADREVILVNGNGVYFGRGARVDTGKLVASTLNIADSVFEKGLRNVSDGSAVFEAGSGELSTALDSAVSVEAGAEIRSAAGGDVLLIAPRVSNQGRIVTPQGQAVLAAGEKVYLMSSSDPAQRGLIVAVDPFKVDGVADATLGRVENAASGSYKTVNDATVADATPDATAGLVSRLNEIRAESGSVNLVGLTVRQAGVINATTAVKGANGAIYLQAMAGTTTLKAGGAEVAGSAGDRGLAIEAGASVRVGQLLGTVEIAAGSSTAVSPDGSARTQLDAETHNPSRIRVEGAQISVASGAQVLAPAGRIELLAATDTQGNGTGSSTLNSLFYATTAGLAASAGADDGSRLVVAPGATLSAAGLRDVAVDGARNQGNLRLFRIELADAPVQRSGPLYRQQVYFDLRDGGKISAANVSGAASAVTRTAQELATAGGRVTLGSQGTVLLGADSQIDVSGGSTHYSATVLANSLVQRDGQVMAFAKLGAGTAADSLLPLTQRIVTPAYTEGQAGGQLAIVGQRVAMADAALAGSVVLGERQRSGASSAATPALLSVQRGATIGSGTGIGNSAEIQLMPAAPAGGELAAGLFEAPLGAAIDGLGSLTTLSLAQVQAGGFGRLSLQAPRIAQPEHGTLDLGAGGALSLRAERSLQVDGSFSAAGGSLQLASDGTLAVSGRSTLSAAGLWTNDSAGAAGDHPDQAVKTQGGSVALRAVDGVQLAAGATLDVSGGAWRNAAGTLATGKAGSLTLSNLLAQGQTSGRTDLDGVNLRGFDFGSGGTLSLSALDLRIDAAAGPLFTLAPGFFSAHGFGQINLATTGLLNTHGGDITVTAATRLAPRLLNWQLAGGAAFAPSGAMRAEVASAQPTDPQLAQPQPVNLSLTAGRPQDLGGSSLVVERGAAIELEAGGTLALAATRNLAVGASGGQFGDITTLSARGGKLALSISGTRGSAAPADDKAGFLADQALWLGVGALLDVSGTALLRPESGSSYAGTGAASGTSTPDGQRLTGSVLGGGSITLAAQRGYVVAEIGSTLLLDGASARLNLPGLGDAVTLARSAGSLSVSTPEGFALEGAISARAPVDQQGRALADGGRLSLAVARGGNETGTEGTAYLDNPFGSSPALARQLLIGSAGGELLHSRAQYGSDLNAALGNGIGYVPQRLLAGSGFAGLELAAGDRLRFTSSLGLDMPLGLTLDAPALSAAPGVQVALSGSVARVGDSSVARAGTPDRSASAGVDSTLSIRAGSIDLLGQWGLQGWASTLLDAGQASGGQIRLNGTQATGERSGSLAFAGTLGLLASQVYATSGTAYALSGLVASSADDAGSTLAIATGSGGAARLAPLSAFGALSASATQITQAGVLQQPFGQISLSAERRLTLADGNLTSVSGQGLTLPYGSTQNVADWVLPGGASASSLPRAKGISLRAAHIASASGATVSASGGGSVQAWEFFPGVGGSSDYFETAGLYAVLPDRNGTQALALGGGAVPAGEAREIVITTPGSGLAPGRYTLLPARYALLAGSLPQGAYLVHRAADQGKTVLSQAIAQDDGSTVVAGYLGSAGSLATGTPGERFVVEPAASFLARSEIRLTDINRLLASRASTLGQATPALPRDGGQVQIGIVGSAGGQWLAALDLQGHGGGAGTLDVSATRLALVDDLARTPEGAVGIRGQLLADSGAGSVLLGGLRSASNAGTGSWTLDASATRQVSVNLGSQALQLQELLITASEDVSLAPGTQLGATASGSLGARTLRSSGAGALLAVSANALTLERDDAVAGSGHLSLGEGSRLSGRQIGLDATGTLQLPASLALSGQAVTLAAPQLVLGTAAAADLAGDASVVDGTALQALRGTAELSLRAYRSLDFAGTQDWARRGADGQASVVAQRLVLDAPLLRGLNDAQGAPAQVDIAAQDLQLRNSSAAATDLAAIAPAPGSSLQLQALPPLRYGRTGGLTLGAGTQLTAFADTWLRSGGDIVLDGSGSHQALGGLTLQSARLTASSGAEQAVSAGDTLRVLADAGARSLGERVGVGAAVSLQARTLKQDGVIDLPGGQLSLAAQGSADGEAPTEALRFGTGSRTSVAGFSLQEAGGQAADGLAGSIAASAARGWISLLGTLDASAALRADGRRGQGDAGSLSLGASGEGGELRLSEGNASGRLLAAAGSASTDLGGRLAVDVSRMASADALADQGRAGGWSADWSLRVRSGDVALGRDLQARRITLAADDGSLRIAGATLDARAPGGGQVTLAAGQSLQLDDAAVVDARSTRAGANGGDVLLAAGSGRLQLAAGAQVDARGDDAADGRIVLRAARSGSTAATASVAMDALNLPRLQAAEIDIEAVRTYSNVSTLAAGSGSGATLGQTTIQNDNAAFMAGQARVLAALGVDTTSDDAARLHLRAGTELRSSGRMTVGADWQLNNARAGGDAGFLTLRAAGDLVLNGSLSDGFSNAVGTGATAGTLNDNARAWSMRLVAGADLSAANPLATRAVAADDASGNLTLAAGKLVRTGAGSLQLAAGRDIVFGSGAQAYVAGRKAAGSAGVLAELFATQTAKPILTEQGGALSLAAGRDIVAAEATQLINNWLWRSGILNADGSAYAGSSQLAWWSQFNRFGQTLGSFGGGDLNVQAGRDIANLQAMAPTSGYADASTPASAALQLANGGDLTARAGRDLLGGQYLLGRGEGRLQASRSIGELAGNNRADAPVLAALDGQWTVAARTDLSINTAFDPTATATSASDNRGTLSPFFYTWGEAAGQRLNASSGTVRLAGEIDASLLAAYGLFTGSLAQPALLNQVMPASLQIVAAQGDIDFSSSARQRSALLFPSAQGSLSLWAGQQLSLGWNLAMADSSPADWPGYASPVATSGFSRLIGTGSNGLLPGTLAGALAGTALHAADDQVARVHAEGSIVGDVQGALRLPVAAEVSAGSDILALRLYAQNQQADDLTRVVAGRNLLAGSTGEISVAGPGQLRVQAGQVVDLESSVGIVTTGNLANTRLPAGGASVTVQAAAAGTLDLAAFEAGYLRDDGLAGATRAAAYRALLLQTVREALRQPALDPAQAWALFQQFPAGVQAAFGQQVLAREFSAVYLQGSVPDSAAMTAQLRTAFETRKAAVLAAGAAALASGSGLTLPGRSTLSGSALSDYLATLARLDVAQLDLGDAVKLRLGALQQARDGWRQRVATALGSTVAALDAAAAADPASASAQAWQQALADTASQRFQDWRDQVLRSELRSSGGAASLFGVASLPMRLALFDQGFRAAELAGLGSFVAHELWPGNTPVLGYSGALDLTQSGILTRRGGSISLLNAGGAINVGLKDDSASANALGVMTLGGGAILAVARDDVQVNNQRIFVVGQGDLDIWSSNGDIDSGRGANTAVAAPRPVARRSVDGVVFETPATTTGAGLGILAAADGTLDGGIALYPAFGEIRALDAYIRAPRITAASTVRGADNLKSPSAIGGAAVVVSAAAPSVSTPPPPAPRSTDATQNAGSDAARQRNALLTVDLLGLGPAEGEADQPCTEEQRRAGRCKP